MTNNSKSFNKPIPHRSKTGEPMEYFILSEDGKVQAKVTRPECIGRGNESEEPFFLFVDEDGGRVYRLPHNDESEELARWNMRENWREDKRHERREGRTATPSINEDGEDALLEIADTSRGSDTASVVEEKALLDTLYAALADLTKEDSDLIRAIFWDNKTERQLAPELGLKEPKSVNKRKHRILERLRGNDALRDFFE